MNKRDFIGKVVISAKTKNRFVLTKIHAVYIKIGSKELDQYGTRSIHMFETNHGDPFTSGTLYFEDAALTERFKQEYGEYCRSEEGRSKAWMYWMQTGN